MVLLMSFAVGFDLWETLITDTPAIARRQEERRLAAIEALLAGAGRPHDREAIDAAYRHTWHRCNDLYWSRDRDIPPRRQIEHFLEHLLDGGDPLEEELVAAIEHAYAFAAAEDLPELVDGAAEVIEAVASRHPVGLVSNTGRTPGWVLREVLRKLGLAEKFSALIFSNEHGACKPERSIFERLRASLGAAPERIVFVGDNLYADVWGAQQAGMTAVHFDNPSRGQAIGPPTRAIGPVVPDATVRSLRDLLPLLKEWER
jgi:putative hydrolase of the HAD superfamily